MLEIKNGCIKREEFNKLINAQKILGNIYWPVINGGFTENTTDGKVDYVSLTLIEDRADIIEALTLIAGNFGIDLNAK